MIIYIFFLIAFVIKVRSGTVITCTPMCQKDCVRYASSTCLICLQYYFQQYSLSHKRCQCFEQFQPAINNPNYCCPVNCKSCGQYGCVKCWQHAILQNDQERQVDLCVCEQNYFQNQTNYQCDCRSLIDPQNYYFDQQLGQCFQCPYNCICSQNGCISCENKTNRKIIINKFNISTCNCIGDLVQKYGICQCLQYCECYDGKVVKCFSESKRQSVFGKFLCPKYFSQINGVCICEESNNLVQLTTDPNNKEVCVCRSKVLQLVNYYFQGMYQCSFCFLQCICDETGCHSCTNNSRFQSINNVCICKANFSETNRNCECQSPFYIVNFLDEQQNNNVCHCLSQKYPQKYYFIIESNSCLICPVGCICNSSGCVFCQPHLMRTIIKLSNDRFACYCQNILTFESQLNICECSYMYVYNQQSSKCLCDTSKINTTFQDQDKETCQICPIGCSCNENGCYSCQNYSYRTIAINSLGRFTCYCVQYTIKLQSGVCGCLSPFVYNKSSNQCQCVEPYYFDEKGNCVCKFIANSSAYYYDTRTNSCYTCPFNCICDNTGCAFCSSDSLRFLMIVNNMYVCPCVSIAYFYHNECIFCPNNSYFYSGQCIECLQCETCDKRGCLSCNDNMYLYNFTCYCIQPILLNVAGQCICPRGYFFNPGYLRCLQCPKACNQCFFNQKLVSCLSCNPQFNRDDIPLDMCKCKEGYLQTFPSSKYCCPLGCSACNQSGCTSCNEHSYRIILNQSCVCPQSMIQYNSNCVCSEESYLFENNCILCPLNCKTCQYDFINQEVICLSCNQNMNRNISTSNCSCLQKYFQAKPVGMKFCVQQLCALNQVNCTQCIEPYVIMISGCVCPILTYQSYHFICEPCDIIQGCIQCQTSSICYLCDTIEGYYLSFYKCYLIDVYDHLQTSIQNKVSVEFYPGIQIHKIISVQTIIARPVLQIIDIVNLYVAQPHYFSQFQVTLQINIITIQIKIPNSWNQSILALTGEFQLTNGSIINKTINILTQLTIYQSPYSKLETIIIEILSVVGLIFGYVVYIYGYKHNQIIFMLQTLSFWAFKLDIQLLNNIYFGYFLKYCFYNFGFHQFQQAFLLRSKYFEQSIGNYNFLTVDANIFRLTGIAIFIASVNLCILIIRFIVIHVKIGIIGKIERIKFSKILFRTFQFIYKTTMYPLIYFSIEMLKTWDRNTLGEQYRIKVANFFSIGVLVTFLFTTIIENISIVATNFYKRSAISQLSSCVLCTIAILFCGSKYSIIIVVIVSFVRNIFYSYNRSFFLNDHSIKTISNYISIAFQTTMLTFIHFNFKSHVMILLLAITLVVQSVHAFFITYQYNKHSYIGKLKNIIVQEEHTKIEIMI